MTFVDHATALPEWFQDLTDQGIVITDTALTVRSWSHWMELSSGYRAETVIGRDLRDIYPDLAARQLQRYFDLALSGRVTLLAQRFHQYLLPMPSPDLAFEHMQQSARIGPLVEDARVVGIVMVISDVTERVGNEQTLRQLLAQEQAARAAAEANQERLALLADVSALLATLFNAPAVLEQVARRLLPLLGEYCSIDIVSERGMHCAALVHSDAATQALLPTLGPHMPAFGVVPMTTDTIDSIADVDSAAARERIGDPVQRQMLQTLGISALLVAPLFAREQIVGVLTLGTAQPAQYQAVDRVFVADVAQRIGAAVDGQQLYQSTQAALHLRDHALSIVEAERSKLHRLFTQAPAAICTLQGPEHVISFANICYRQLNGDRDLVGMPIRVARPELVEQGFVAMLDQVYRSGAPYVGIAARALVDRQGTGTLEEGFFDFVYQPTHDLDGTIDGILVHSTDVTAQVRAQRERETLSAQVQEQRERLRVTLASIGDAVIVTDMQANITFMNRVAETLTGWPQADALDQFIDQVFTGIDEESGEAAGNPVRCIIEHRNNVGSTTPMLLSTRQGTLLPIDNTVAPIRNEAGEMIGVVLVFRDTSGRRREEHERAALLARTEAARAEAEDAVRMRDVFFSVAAHELKTPLTSLLGTIQLVQRRAVRDAILQERELRSFEVIENQARRLQKMIDALLDITRIEAGQLSLAHMEVNIDELVQRIVQEIQPTLTKHTISYNASNIALLVSGDALRLEQVLQNLIQNAVKYSPSGGAVVVHAAARGSTICVSVSDQGIGIPQAALPQLFQRFYRASNVSGAREISGIGIGLYVVREIVTLHAGTVQVESTEGVGTTFTVCLPALAHAPSQLSAPVEG